MRYIDPYQFFELQLARPEDLTSSVLRRARQRKLAEFELSADGFLYWEGEALEKRMALDLAEALEDPKRQKFYWRIHQDKALTTFFKGDQVAPLKTIFINSIVQDPEFRDFCSPFFATTFDRILRPATEARDWMDARFLLGKSELIRVEDMDRAYGPIIRFMERTVLDLERITESNHAASDATPVDFVMWENFPPFVNALPDHYQQLINKISRKMRDMAIAFDKNAEQKANPAESVGVAWLMICAACNLNAEVTVREDNVIYKNRIKVRFEKFHPPKKTETKTQTSGSQAAPKTANPTNWKNTAIGLAVIFVFLVFIGFICNPSRKRNRSKNTIERITSIPSFESKKLQTRPYTTGHLKKGLDQKGAHGLYANLNDAYEGRKITSEKSVQRPKTGFIPYAEFCDQPRLSNEGNNNGLSFKNKSSKDIVLLIDKGYSSNLQAAFYIRAGEKLNKILLRDGIYFFYIYPGENWSDSIAEFEEKPLPGFAISGKYVGPESRLNRFEPPKIVSSFTGRFLPKKEFEFRRDSIVEVY